MPNKTVPTKAFVDYYNANNIIPVSQDLTDIDSFIYRRNYLYTTLGFPLALTRNLNVIEFGPGGGYNAVATSHFGPSNYVFVDATTASISELKRKKAAGLFKARNTTIAESDIFDYRDTARYNLVICEGVIPGQNDPRRMIKHVGSFCDAGGVFITTTSSASSLLSEICRRVLRPSIIAQNRTFQEQTKIGANLFRSHLMNLATSTRPAEDWVQDVILHDWHKGEYFFSMIDAMTALEGEFEFYSSSPRFLSDDRWYKQVNPGSLSSNDLLKQQYPLINALFLDFRIPLRTILQIKDTERLSSVETLSKTACAIHNKIVDENSYNRLEEFVATLIDLTKTLPEEFEPTKISLLDFIKGIRNFSADDSKSDFGDFGKWWGRGQQYVSFIKTAFAASTVRASGGDPAAPNTCP
jgi:2-polyprenyl-3-methyl-5-hydroxy-6-metoxy-1,4-benzoquinol methylase